jgi:hypothetical protein
MIVVLLHIYVSTAKVPSHSPNNYFKSFSHYIIQVVTSGYVHVNIFKHLEDLLPQSQSSFLSLINLAVTSSYCPLPLHFNLKTI